jgi:ubiquinone/menaquinone biosynthesis C-methylase UbiE
MRAGHFLARKLFLSCISRGVFAETDFSRQIINEDPSDPAIRFRKARFEVAGVGDFFRCFANWNLPAAITDKVVLDFGCGYGGKTAEYAAHCGARRVCGIEPFPDVIDLAAAFARHQGTENVEFRVCKQLEIPYEEAMFDVVLSHDVLEHVENPMISLREVQRVLKPGGLAFVVFPPYGGMASHHLDYICSLPAVHWVFSPQTLIDAVNSVLSEDHGSRLSVKRQPAPKLSWDAERYVLPSLNGLTGTKFERMAHELFHVESLEWAVLGRNHKAGWKHWVHAALKPLTLSRGPLRDAVTASIVAVLRKRAPGEISATDR